MTEPGNKEQYGEDSQTPAEGAEEERINDPLTRTDVEAPRVLFGSQPSPEGGWINLRERMETRI